jgi:nitrogen regulatory protein PII
LVTDKHVCFQSQFKCPAHEDHAAHCINGTSRCDNIIDCPGKEDEQDCSEYQMSVVISEVSDHSFVRKTSESLSTENDGNAKIFLSKIS